MGCVSPKVIPCIASVRAVFRVVAPGRYNMPNSLWPGGAKPSQCIGCPHAHKKQPFVPGWGSLRARLIVIAEKPGACEEGRCRCAPKSHERLKPLVGKSGKRLDIGLGDRTDCFLTNVRKCNAEDVDAAERAASIKHCVRAYLQPEMDAIDRAHREAGVESAAVIGIGADAAKVHFGRANMQKFHGTAFTRKERDAMIATAEMLSGEDIEEEPSF